MRKASSVTKILRDAGVQTGFRYTQTGYMRHGVRASGEGAMISRMVKDRYSGMVDGGGVHIYLIGINDGNSPVSESLIETVHTALVNAGLKFSRNHSGDHFFVEDD